MKTSKLYPIKVNFSKKKECLVIGFILQNDNMDYIFYDNKIEACNLILNSFQKKELKLFLDFIILQIKNNSLSKSDISLIKPSKDNFIEIEYINTNGLYDKEKIIDNLITIAVQVNGKVRSEITISNDTSEDDVKNIALTNEDVISWIDGKEVKRVIYVKGRIVNIVV